MRGKLYRRDPVKILISAGAAVIVMVYVSLLRVNGGLLYRRLLFTENSAFGLVLAVISTLLFSLAASRLNQGEEQIRNYEKSNKMMLELVVLLLLMFPGTGLGMRLLTNLGVPESIPFFMSGISYCFIPVFYTVNIKKRKISELGFADHKYIFEDFKVALIVAFLSIMIIDPVNVTMERIAGLQKPSSEVSGFPLFVLPLVFAFHGVGMIQNIAWNGLIQRKIEDRYNWSQRGFIISFLIMAFLLQAYFEPKANLQALVAHAPGNTIGLLIMCYLFHKTKRIYTPAFWHWFTNFIGMIPYT